MLFLDKTLASLGYIYIYIKLFFLPRTESQATDGENKAKKLTLPLFGAMKGGSKFKLKTGTVGVSCRSRS